MAEQTGCCGPVHKMAEPDGPCRCGQIGVLREVLAERHAQDERWGEQNHPDLGPWVAGWSPTAVAGFYGLPTAARAKAATDTAAELGTVSWAHIAGEELAEAIEAAALGDEQAVRAEVVQLAAVCVQWARAIDRRRAER